MPRDACPVCDRLDGWQHPPHPECQPPGCDCDACQSRCWGGWQCEAAAVDWRARALAVEERLAQPPWPPVDERVEAIVDAYIATQRGAR